jgi:hydroxypyruvate isomerase
MLFNEVGFVDRFEAAAQAGFKGVEYLFPYEYDATLLRDKLRAHGLTQVLHNLPAGNWPAGERGIACHPDRKAEFEEGVDRAIRYANTLGCPQVNCLAGAVPPGVGATEARSTFIANLKFAAPRLKGAGIKLLIEPINTRDIPNFFLNRTAQALDIISEVGSDNLFLQYDAYHMQIMEGDLSMTLQKHLAQIAHIQIADPPARNEPGTGEINFTNIFRLLDKLGYKGWIGCEYKPAGKTTDGLGWRSMLEGG